MNEISSLCSGEEIDADRLVQLINAAKNGDEDCLARVASFVYSRVYRYIFYRVHHREDAEDLTSEVILKIMRALPAQHGNFLAWVYKIAANTVIDFYRRRGHDSVVSISDLASDIADKAAPFSDRVLTQENLRKAMSDITEDQKRVVILRFIEGYNNEEVAKIMGKSVGAVKVLQFRALKSLREYFLRKGYK